jgi:hypothetical protein
VNIVGHDKTSTLQIATSDNIHGYLEIDLTGGGKLENITFESMNGNSQYLKVTGDKTSRVDKLIIPENIIVEFDGVDISNIRSKSDILVRDGDVDGFHLEDAELDLCNSNSESLSLYHGKLCMNNSEVKNGSLPVDFEKDEESIISNSIIGGYPVI